MLVVGTEAKLVVEHEYLGIFLFRDYLLENINYVIFILLMLWSFICIKSIIDIFIVICDKKNKVSKEEARDALILCYGFILCMIFPYMLLFEVLIVSEIL